MTTWIRRRRVVALLLGTASLGGGAFGAPARAAAADFIRAIENGERLPPLGPGARGPAVVRAQILLDRQWFSSGEIDGHFGANLQRTVRSFQYARRLRPTGRIDA